MLNNMTIKRLFKTQHPKEFLGFSEFNSFIRSTDKHKLYALH